MAKISIYDKQETDFSHNGTVLTDATECTIEEELNGMYLLELEYPVFGNEKHKLLTEENVIKADGQLFRIHSSVGNLGYKSVSARHIFYDLLANFLEDVRPTDMNLHNALNHLLENTQYPHGFVGVSDVGIINTQYFVRKNPIEAILGKDSLTTRWGGELVRDNHTIKLLKNRGKDKGAQIAYGKNLMGLDVEKDTDDMATRIMPIGKDGLLLPEKYIDSPLIDNYTKPYVKLVEVDAGVEEGTEDKAEVTEEQAYQMMRDAVAELYEEEHVDEPYVNIKADLLLLENTEEYKHIENLVRVGLGDTVSCTDNPLGITFSAKVIRVKQDVLTGRNVEVELGKFKRGISDKIGGILDQVKEEIENTTSGLQDAVDRATDVITSALGGHVVKREGELLIMDTDDPLTATRVWRWNLSGLGYSNNGIDGDYKLAMTMDGEIVADFITSGSLDASLIKTGMIKSQKNDQWINLENGYFKLGGMTYDERGFMLRLGHDGKTVEETIEEGLAKAPVYTWVKYSNNSDGEGMHDDPLDAKYIGRAYNKPTEKPSLFPGDYDWVKIQGEDGQSPAVGVLSRSSMVIPTYADGTGGDYSDAEVEMDIYVGHDNDTANWSISATLLGSAKGRLVGNKYILDEMNDDRIAITISGTKAGYDRVSRVFTVAKAKSGVSPSVGVLVSDSHVFPATSNGEVTSYAGASTELRIYEGDKDFTDLWDYAYKSSVGVTDLSIVQTDNKIEITSMADTVDEAYVDITASRAGQDNITKRFRITKAKKGYPASAYLLQIDNKVIMKAEDGTLSQDTITMKAYEYDKIDKDEDDSLTAYEGKFRIETSTNGKDFTKVYATGTWEHEKIFTIPEGTKAIDIYLIGASSDAHAVVPYNILDKERVAVVEDGVDGAKGEPGRPGKDGNQGVPGIPGRPGKDGRERFTWIKYAEDKEGNGMSDFPEGRKYIGIAENKLTDEKSTDPLDYRWAKIQGDKGIPGDDGQAKYTWVMYADDDKGTNMSESPKGKRYIGIGANRNSERPSRIPTAYTWSPLYDNVRVGGTNLLPNSNFRNGEIYNGWSDVFGTQRIEEGMYIKQFTSESPEGRIEKEFHLDRPGVFAFSIFAKTPLEIEWRDFVGVEYQGEEGEYDTGFTKYTVFFTNTTGGVKTIRGYVPNIGVGQEIMIQWEKLEQGNVATDWTPAPEDIKEQLDEKTGKNYVDEEFRTVVDGYESFTKKTVAESTEILQQKLENTEGDIKTLQNTFSVTSSGFRSDIDETIERMDEEQKRLDETVNTYLDFGVDGLELGKSSDDMQVIISNEEMKFVDSGKKVAYINGQRMKITSLDVVSDIKVGNHELKKYGDLTIGTWRGDD